MITIIIELILQVALDEMVFKRAVQIANEDVDYRADYIEAGTTLIKSVGMDAVRTQKNAFPATLLLPT